MSAQAGAAPEAAADAPAAPGFDLTCGERRVWIGAISGLAFEQQDFDGYAVEVELSEDEAAFAIEAQDALAEEIAKAVGAIIARRMAQES